MTTEPNPIVDGVRDFYERSRALGATEMPGITWPAFSDLDKDQLRAWILAFAATAEVAVRMTEALLAINIPEDRL